MVVGEPKRSIMEGIENTGDVRLHDHRLRLKQRFDIIRKLGQGTYGKVQLGINKKTSQEVAIKTIKKCKIETEADLVRIRREVQIMSSVRHPNIVHIYEVFENSEKMILVMEYCAGGELYDYLSQQKVLQEDEARRLFRQIATACYYCHKHKICHRDLKLENVLLDEHGNAKIADFGLSNVFEERRLLSTFCGSPLYASPEIVKGTPYIGPEVDCWSLGVLLYTLVYGAMPFDGSNFKRLVKQISTGDYFEPKNPSSASPLIRDMLTVDPIQRADIVHICDHPWVNKGSDVSCLELAEALANETPVRLDLLLSLAPPPQHGSDKLVVTDEATSTGAEGSPGHSMSMTNVDNSAERRILEMVAEGGTDAIKPSPTRTIVGVEQPKRKLETTLSMDNAAGLRKKERFIRSSSQINQTPSQNEDVPVSPSIENNAEPTEIQRDVSMSNENKLDLSALSQVPKAMSPSSERVEEARAPLIKDPDVPLPPAVTAVDEPHNELPPPPPQNKTPVNAKKDIKTNPKVGDSVLKERNCVAKPFVASKKKLLITSKTDEKKSFKPKEKSPPRKSTEREAASVKKPAVEEETLKSEVTVEVKQPVERRKSRILDAAEKLNNLTIQPAQVSSPPVSNLSPPLPKPKKVLIPGVSVGSFKEQFERRASLTSGSAPTVGDLLKKAPNKTVQANAVAQPVVKALPVKKVHSVDSEHPLLNNKESTNIKLQSIGVEPSPPTKEKIVILPAEPRMFPLPDTASKISKPLHKSESLKEPSTRKDTLHNSLSLEDARRSLQQSMALLSEARNDYHTSRSVEDNSTGENERQKQLKVAREIISNAIGEDNGKKVHRICMGGKPPIAYGAGGRSASGSLSLGGRASPPPSPPRTFRTEVQHRVDDVRNKFLPTSRGGSVERIIPISFVSDAPKPQNTHTQLPYQRNKTMPYRLSSIPRGNVQGEVEKVTQPPTPPTPSTSHQAAEPIKKSPREFIIPIAVEGLGYVTPRQGSLEPSENKTPTKMPSSNISFSSRFPKPRRLSSLVSGGESEDDEDLHMHRLRSSRRVRADAEKDSISSGEEDDDEGFELLTAENLFSTLLDRVRSLTNRLNGEEGTGFPQHHQSLFNNLHSPFFNSPHLPRKHKKHSTIREGPSWRRSTSRDIASDFDSMFPSHTTFPRGSRRRSRKTRLANGEPPPEPSTAKDNPGNPDTSATSDTLDLSDLDLSKMELSEKEVEALSGLTPALSRRLQQQLLAHLPPAAARSLRRTLSAHLPPSSHSTLPYTRSLSATKQTDSDTPAPTPQISNSNADYSSPSFSDSVSILLPLSSHTTLPCTRSLSTTTAKQTDSDTPTPEIETNSYAVPSSATKQTDSNTSALAISHFTPEIEANSNADYASSRFSELASLKNAKSWHSIDTTGKYDSSPINESITPKAPSAGRYTPNGSVLSKYLSAGEEYPSSLRNYEHGGLLEREPGYTAAGSALSSIPMGGSLRRRSLRTPPADTSHRRVSRFLRPDFFDTPREESLYVRDKKEKELETQKILKEIRQKKSRHSDLPSPSSPVAPTDVADILSARSGYRNSLSPVGIPVSKDKSRSVTPFHPILDNISEYHSDPITAKDELVSVDHKLDSSSNNCQTDKSFSQIQSPSQNNCPSVNTDRGSFKFNNKESRLVRPKSFPTKPFEEDGYNATERNVGKKDACTNIPTNSFTSKDSKLARPKSYPNSSQSPEKAFSPVIENGNLNQANNTNYCDMAKPVPLQNGSLENDQNVSVSFSLCLPSRNTNKLNVLKTESSSKELSIKKYVVVKSDIELGKEAPILNNAENSALIECKDSVKILQKSVSGLNPLSELLLKADNGNFKVSDIESTLRSDMLNSGIQLENNSLSEFSLGKGVTDIANGMKPKVLDSDNNLEKIVLPENSVDEVTAPNKILEIRTSLESDVVTADTHLENNFLSKSIIDKTPPKNQSDFGSTLKPIAFTSDNHLESKVEENAGPLTKSDLEEKTEKPCPDEKKKKIPGKKKIVIKKKVVKKADLAIETSSSAIIKEKPPKNEEEKIVPAKKKSVLHSIGEKIEKFRNDSFNRSASQEKDSASEAKSKPQLPIPKDEVKPSRIDNVMRALRERSVPSGDMAESITESGLIKRAVTVTDLPTLNTKISTSKKSVNRVLGLFKKIESKDKSTKTVLEKSGNDLVNVEIDRLPIEKNEKDCSGIQLSENNKPKRPTSLLLNGIGKRVQACYNGASSDSVLAKEIKYTPKPENSNFDGELKSQKKGLRLDFSRLPKLNQGIFNKRNSLDLSKSQEGSQSKEVESNEWQNQSHHKTQGGSQSKEGERNHRCQSLTAHQNLERCQTKEVDSGNEWQSQSYHKTREGSQSEEVERNHRCQSLTTRQNPERCQSKEVKSGNEWHSQSITTHQNPERCQSKEVKSGNEWHSQSITTHQNPERCQSKEVESNDECQSQSYYKTSEGGGQSEVESNRQPPEESKSKDIENNLQWQSQSSRKSQECREVGNGSWESQNSQQNYDPTIDTFINGGTKANECSSNNLNNDYSPANNTLISPNWSPDCDTRKFMIEPDADYNQNSSQPPPRSYEATSPDPENIIDRIRRKSFYNRFNEKKNRRKSQLVGPGAKEYIPSERIHSQVDGDSSYHSKYDYTPSSSKYERPQTLELTKLSDNGGSSSPTKYRGSNSFGTDHLSPTSHKSLDRNERRYLLEPQYHQPYSESNLHYSMPRYSRTVSLLDNNDTYQPATEYKNSSRYGRSFSLLSPTSYGTLSPRAPPRNSAILLRDSGDVEPTTESVLTKIRNRKKLAAMSPTTDDEESYLDKKIRSNHTSNNERDKSTDQAE